MLYINSNQVRKRENKNELLINSNQNEPQIQEHASP